LGSDDRRAAQHLFAALRRLDGSGAAWILAETPREQGGLWPALRDRLARAAATR
ncbi:MAG: Sua5 family C-terminal domain-containing protein, partial [Myxococcota bacterium]